LFYALAINGKWKRAEKILKTLPIADKNVPIGGFDRGAKHKSRFSGGKLRGGARGSLLIRNNAPLFTYIKKKQLLVGYAKSGWVTLARKYGRPKAFPAWISKNKGPSSKNDQTRSDKIFATGTNEVNYVSNLLTRGDQRAAAQREERVAVDLANKASSAAARKSGL